MSVKELVLREGKVVGIVKCVNEGRFTIDIADGLKPLRQIGLDRNQAHLLMLYLQEHLFK